MEDITLALHPLIILATVGLLVTTLFATILPLV